MEGSWIVEQGEDSHGTVCNEPSGICRSYAHFIFVVSAQYPLDPMWAGSLISVDGGDWQPAETSQMILEQLHLPENKHSMVFSVQYDRMTPKLMQNMCPKKVCAVGWFRDLEGKSCGTVPQICADTKTTFETTQLSGLSGPLGFYKFGNWTSACDLSNGVCRVMGHHALSVVTRFPSISPISMVGEVAWTETNETPSSDAWVAVGKCGFLSVFDNMTVNGTEVRSQRFHCGFNQRRPFPLPNYACVRFTATDDTTGDSLAVDLSTGRGGYHVGSGVRCFPLQMESLEPSTVRVI
jgi:hypothetical protein